MTRVFVIGVFVALVVGICWPLRCRHADKYMERAGQRRPNVDPFHFFCVRCGKDLGLANPRAAAPAVRQRYLGYDPQMQARARHARRAGRSVESVKDVLRFRSR